MKTGKKRSCVDCLLCKVSKMSNDKCRLCYCSGKKTRIIHQESYWLKKTVCQKFKGMGA
jgi:hypothetical protein